MNTPHTFYFLLTLTLSLILFATHLSPLHAQSESQRDRERTETPGRLPGENPPPKDPGIQVEPSVNIQDLSPYQWPRANGHITVNLVVSIPASLTDWTGDLEVSLSDVTNYPGQFGNSSDGSTTPDLSLETAENPNWTLAGSKLTRQISGTGTQTLTVKVSCHDYAAAGVLKAKLSKSSGQQVSAATARVPRDDDENGVVDGFDTLYPTASGAGDPGEVDNETGPLSNPHNGDGFTYWEEYRGFSVKSQTQPTRLNPTKKDIFTYSEFDGISYWEANDNGSGLSITDVGYAHNLPVPFELHVIYESDTDDRHVNYRSPGNKRRFKQYAVFVDEFTERDTIQDTRKWVRANTSDKDGRILGVAQSRSVLYSAPNAPAGMKSALVFPIFPLNPGKTANPDTQNIIDSTVGHELGHNIFLPHTGDAQDIMYEGGKYNANFSVIHKDTYNLIPQTKFGEWVNGLFLRYIAPPSEAPNNPPGQNPPGGGNPPGESPSGPSGSLSPANGSYFASAGSSHTANFTASEAYNSVYWYVKSPSETGLGTNVEIDPGGSDMLTASMTYTFASDASGAYVITAYVYNYTDSAVYQASYTVNVSSSSSPDPVPDPDPDPVKCGNKWKGPGKCDKGTPTTPDEHLETSCDMGCGNSYWTCNPTARAHHETSYVCQRTGCGMTFANCTNKPGSCLNTDYLYHKKPD